MAAAAGVGVVGLAAGAGLGASSIMGVGAPEPPDMGEAAATPPAGPASVGGVVPRRIDSAEAKASGAGAIGVRCMGGGGAIGWAGVEMGVGAADSARPPNLRMKPMSAGVL
jgi:hypothetical protein